MLRQSAILAAATAALALAGCGSGANDPAQTAQAGASDAEAAETGGTATAAAGAPSAASTDAAAADLAAYVGKYPSDKVAGVSWNEHPAVLAAIRASVGDPAVRQAVLELPGPSAPIELIGGKVSAWSCEVHNCGQHQWTVMVDPASGAADVCYFNEEQDAGNSRWFLAGGTQEKRPGNCQVEEGG